MPELTKRKQVYKVSRDSLKDIYVKTWEYEKDVVLLERLIGLVEDSEASVVYMDWKRHRATQCSKILTFNTPKI